MPNQPETPAEVAQLDVGGEDDVLATLSEFFGLERWEIEERNRRHEVARARQIIMYLLREYGGMSFPAIGRLVGKRDHTTTIHAYTKIKEEAATDPHFFEQLAGPIALATSLGKRRILVEEKIRGMNEELRKEVAALLQSRKAIKAKPKVRVIPERDLKVLEMYREGLTLQNMASMFNLSRERIRQIVVVTIRNLAINESITKGIVMDVDVLMEEESKKRKTAQDSKKPIKPKKIKNTRWSTYYDACKVCNSTVYPHVKQGLCEQCAGSFRGKIREDIINKHSSSCDMCHISRPEAIRTYGRDFYVKKDRSVLCRKCFLENSGLEMGHYKKFEWSRHYAACKNCGTTTVPFSGRGLCINCAGSLSNEGREKFIVSGGSRCSRCGLPRAQAVEKFNTDLRVTKLKETLCMSCFQKYIREKRS